MGQRKVCQRNLNLKKPPFTINQAVLRNVKYENEGVTLFSQTKQKAPVICLFVCLFQWQLA